MGCGQPCVGFYCYLCTCQQCGFSLNDGTCMNCTYGVGKPVTCCECESPLNGGFCLILALRAGNSSACDPNPNSYNNSPNFSDHTPQPQYETYLCELCGNNSHYGYDCPPRFPLVYEQESCYNQNYNDNYYSHNSPSFLCCDNCGGPHETFRCQPMNQNFYTNSSSFDQIQPSQYYDMHQPPEESVRPKTIVISALEGEFQPPQETSVKILQAKEDLMKSIQTFLKKFNRISFGETPKILLLAWEKFSKIQHAKPEDIQELLHQLLKYSQIIIEELSEYINCPSWNRPTFYDNDDEEYSIQFKEYLENSSKAITPDLPTEEPDNSLSMGDEHLSTIPETESDEVIKSSVENLVPIPRESEGVSDDTCDVPSCDNSPPLDVLNDHFEIFSDFNDDCTSSDNDSFENIDYVEASPPEDFLIMGNEELSTIPEKELDEFIKSSVEDLVPIPSESTGTSENDSESVLPSSDDFSPIFEEKSMTFSNPLFNSNDDFTSSDDESLSDEDVPEEDVKIYSNPLFEFDDEYISSDINPLFDEMLEDIECKDSYDSNLDESTFLVTPLSDLNEDECVDPGDDIDEIDAFYHDSEGDIHYLESLLSDNITLSLPPKVFLDHDPRSLSNDLKIMVKVFDPGIHEKKFSPTYESLTFEDRHYLSFTYVIRTFLPYFTYPVVSPFPLSSGSEDIIFDPGISAFHFSLEPVAFKCPMEVCSSTCFIPNFTMIWGESS
ncbi:hypothetical protein Tco_0781564 [Tanacetum coccineum]